MLSSADPRTKLPELSDRLVLLNNLARLGPQHSTTVMVNGRPVLLSAALQLIDRLPEDALVSLRHRYLSTRPDPLAAQPPVRRHEYDRDLPAPREVARRILQGQRAADRTGRRVAKAALGAFLALGPIMAVGLLLLVRFGS